ncbi:MAG: sodium:calcium antiporter [Haloferacaceae archaeon]
MLLPLAGALGGLLLLLVGADRTVRAAAEVAVYYGVSTFFVGVTVVSIGTSIPEMTTSVYAASYGAGDLVVGNIVGSETAQITLALGVVALIAPIETERRTVLVYGGAMVLAMVMMILTLDDGVVRSEGLLMMLAYAIFVHDLYTSEGGEEVVEEIVDEPESPRQALPTVAFGILLVIGGGHLLVTNGTTVAALLGVPTYLVGFLTGLGTTAPEIGVAGLAARRGDHGVSLGALLGSNITDPVFSLGVGALVADVTVSDPGSVLLSTGYMLGVSLLVLGLLYWRRGLGRRAAVLCLLLYLPSLAVL